MQISDNYKEVCKIEVYSEEKLFCFYLTKKLNNVSDHYKLDAKSD